MINQHLTSLFCPQLIRNVRTVRRIDSSSIITHPVNFCIVGGVAKKYDDNNSIYIVLNS